MILFEPDIFSHKTPIWTRVSERSLGTISSLLNASSVIPISRVQSIDQSGAIELNSNNFRISTASGQYLLKRWSNSNRVSLRRLLKLMVWLRDAELPAPMPVLELGEPFLVGHAGSLWSLFHFVQGDYFEGSKEELKTAAALVAQLHTALARAPSYLVPGEGPIHNSQLDIDLFRNASAQRVKWVEIFGSIHARVLRDAWPTIEKTYEGLRHVRFNQGVRSPAHFDIHPHNILTDGAHIAAVLDFDSCKMMYSGYALAFSGLKLCRQSVTTSRKTLNPAKIGEIFLEQLIRTNPALEDLAPDFTKLATSEVLRRIALIIRLNLERSDRSWNHILPIQVRHIGESEALFGSLW
jgi:hypothetical protein